jgi:hypothetical protein
VRTTITLDEDVDDKIKQRMRETGASFKQTVNEMIRHGWFAAQKAKSAPPFKVQAYPLKEREGLSYDNIEELLDQIEGPDRLR